MTVSSPSSQTTGLVVVDTQENLLSVMRRGPTIVENIVRLLKLAGQQKLPVIATAQYPRMLGPFPPEIAALIPAPELIEKMDFDCCAVGEFSERLRAMDRRVVILSGVETHICVLQTCVSLLAAGYDVFVPQDAVDSRTEENWRVGTALMKEAGAVITSTETLIFQILRRAGTPEFKEMLRIVK